jgi:hypothetical protein
MHNSFILDAEYFKKILKFENCLAYVQWTLQDIEADCCG